MRSLLSLVLPFLLLNAAPCGALREVTNSLGMKLVRIEPGEFVMGSAAQPPRDRPTWETRDWDEAPAHKVRISKAFYLGAFEVTNAQFERFNPDHRALRGKFGSSATDDEPVTHVSWQQARDFCVWLSNKENKPYRLPTEAEWEYACRAGTTTLFHTGDALAPEQANIGLSKDGRQKLATTTPVGSYAPSAWGLYDMHGNVLEWCHDWYGPYDGAAQVDPVGRADGYARVARGGSFLIAVKDKNNARFCRSANRSGFLPEDANRHTGFRVVLGELPSTKPLPVVVPLNQQNVRQVPATKGGANKPFFIDFTAEGKNPTIPSDAWGPVFAQHNHFGAVCVCPNGDVLACWYSTVRESGREMVQAASRLRAGTDKWEPSSLFFTVPDVNCHAPVLLCDGKRIYHFANQAQTGWDNASVIVRTSDDSGATWSPPRIMLSRDDPERQSQPCTAFVAQDGAVVVAIDGDVHRDERLLISRDAGQHWRLAKDDMRKTMGGKYVIHPAVAQRADGAILSFLRGPHPMPLLVSKDMGDSWQASESPFPGIGGGQKATVLKLASGALLLCSIDTRKALVGGGTFAALSLDDGATWSHVRKVDGVGGYMAVAQAPNGMIYLFGTRMGCAAFNEGWLRAGKGLRQQEAPPPADAVGQKPMAQPAKLTRDQVIEQTLKPFHGISNKGVDCSTMIGKVLCGYQGWHAAQGDDCGRGWYHWTGRNGFRPGSTNVDLWPDVSELDADERYATPFKTADGTAAEVYSAFNAKTVIRHFQWMRDYGIDGVFVQRFAGEVFNPLGLRQFNTVLDHCREGANKYGRTYAVMYDLSGMRAGQMDKVKDDWKLLLEKMTITKDPAYLHHNGKPVVAVWGFGFSDRRKYTLEEGLDLVAFLKSAAGGQCTVMLGVPTYWRTQERDTVNDKTLHELILKADVVSPWTVGRFGTSDQDRNYAAKTMVPDIAWCKQHDKEYLPVVFPGFSWHNQNPRFPVNQIPRKGGAFLWSQFAAAKKAGATMVYQAMFDEVDEGTAIYKCTNNVPIGASQFLTYEGLPSDHYLKVVGAASKMIRGDASLSEELPALLSRIRQP